MSHILVIDDDPDVALATRMVLESGGHVVREARNGDEGIRLAQEQRPDLIVLDVMMDTATEGFQTAHKLRNPDPASNLKDYASIPIIMLTAIHDTTPMRFSPDDTYLPVDRFMDKPVNPDKLLAAVAELTSKARA